jgi:biopolymer transport protein ExbD
MNFRRKKREKLDITLISMIDVLFVLLLFFMVSSTFNRNTEVKVTLPEADGAEAEQYPKTVTLTIYADGTYYLEGNDG